ncbi:RNA methyltransferase TrmH, group 3 [Mycolicibacterium phlei]|uniref:TfoX/Sxy family protein n=1 Tax=Mycobacteroides chelonae TaxID=1774 RepID=UPI000618B162|nr:TfoX/Sxy family protein [Mycobacteroides chelonae]VEG20355.1 RNA methyltransferase TrmH, group 3 [Mycolicibacterium phlei]AKC40701.1 RNA methyltransferase [Mycobacteroides chelonae]ANB00404.1 RNA methyltransferase [Mycobacteroides chelonae CCUG 47445]AYM44024.1 TfoX family protein [[Mycobacterium] chelonae subsp. gwanakae]MBF9318444.1 TfoX/Sxy family protein [Mycobacteroides chelonae]
MAYDEDLVERIREVIATTKGVTEKRMFGGLAFLVDGHMTVAAKREGGLLARCDPTETEALVTRTHVSRMVMGGREMAGWLSIEAEGVRTRRQLEPWVKRALVYAGSLPPK